MLEDKSKKAPTLTSLTSAFVIPRVLVSLRTPHVPNATIDDIDLDFVAAYTKKIGYGRSPLDYLRGNKDFIITRNGTEQIISAATCSLERIRSDSSPRARVRFIRYDAQKQKLALK